MNLLEYEDLPESEKMFTHVRNGRIFLYSEPERYVNHSADPNVFADFVRDCDVAARNIQKGEEITCDDTREDF